MFGLNYFINLLGGKIPFRRLLAIVFALAPVVNILFELLFFGRRIGAIYALGAQWWGLWYHTHFGLVEIFAVGRRCTLWLSFSALVRSLCFRLAQYGIIRNHAAALPVFTCNATRHGIHGAGF